MKKLVKNPLVRALLLLAALLLSLVLTASAQNLDTGDRIQFSVRDDSLVVKSDLMPMVRYNFIFHFDNHDPVSMTYQPNKFKGDIVMKVTESAKRSLKAYALTKIEIIDPMKNKKTITILSNRFYFVNFR